MTAEEARKLSENADGNSYLAWFEEKIREAAKRCEMFVEVFIKWRDGLQDADAIQAACDVLRAQGFNVNRLRDYGVLIDWSANPDTSSNHEGVKR